MQVDKHLPTPGPGIRGRSRQAVRRNYALLPPEGLMASTIPSLAQTAVYFLAAPALGASFVQFLALVEPSGGSRYPLIEAGVQHFYYVLGGSIALSVGDGEPQMLTSGSYAYLPPDIAHSISNDSDQTARVLGLRKLYEPAGPGKPEPIISARSLQHAVTRRGLPGRTWQYLLPPGDMRFDMEMNILSFDSGAFFENIETHVMEHGLYMLEGHGMYLLGRDWHETRFDDFIWMGPYCPQYFVPGENTPTAYLLYKNVNRDIPLLDKGAPQALTLRCPEPI